MIKIFGHPLSTCTRKVLMTLAETGTPYELVTVDFATRDHKKPPHLNRQPFGQVPAIDDDGFAFYESRAICRYINERSQAVRCLRAGGVGPGVPSAPGPAVARRPGVAGSRRVDGDLGVDARLGVDAPVVGHPAVVGDARGEPGQIGQ